MRTWPRGRASRRRDESGRAIPKSLALGYAKVSRKPELSIRIRGRRRGVPDHRLRGYIRCWHAMGVVCKSWPWMRWLGAEISRRDGSCMLRHENSRTPPQPMTSARAELGISPHWLHNRVRRQKDKSVSVLLATRLLLHVLLWCGAKCLFFGLGPTGFGRCVVKARLSLSERASREITRISLSSDRSMLNFFPDGNRGIASLTHLPLMYTRGWQRFNVRKLEL